MTKPKINNYNPHANVHYRYAHEKYDGHFLNVLRSTGDGKVLAVTSSSNDIFNQLQFMSDCDVWRKLPMGMSVYGELYVPNKTRSAVKTAISVESPHLKFAAFAVAGYPGADTVKLRAARLEFVANLCGEAGLSFLPFHVQPFDVNELLNKRPLWVEGYVLKNGNLLDDAVKLKPRPTIDLVVTGYTRGTGKNAELVGSICVSTYEGYAVADVAGMSDAQRMWVSQNTEQLLGKVIEVEYQEVGSRGRLLHPSYLRIRDDKTPEECSVRQDEQLAKHWSTGTQRTLDLKG